MLNLCVCPTGHLDRIYQHHRTTRSHQECERRSCDLRLPSSQDPSSNSLVEHASSSMPRNAFAESCCGKNDSAVTAFTRPSGHATRRKFVGLRPRPHRRTEQSIGSFWSTTRDGGDRPATTPALSPMADGPSLLVLVLVAVSCDHRSTMSDVYSQQAGTRWRS